MTDLKKILDIALEEVGYLEKKTNAQLDDKTANAGSNNYTKYWRDIYPSLQANAWCLCFCVWCFVQAFGEKFAKQMLYMKDYTFYTPTAAQYFQQNKAWFDKPQIGDLIFFKNSQRIHHVGIVTKVSATTVYTIEGNAGAGQQVTPNGGSVCQKSYSLNNANIAGYGRPKFKDAVTTVNEVKIIDEPVSTDRRGLKILADTLNVRKTPVDGEVVKTYTKNTRVMITAKAKGSDGKYWFKTSDGYISGNYVEGWVKEANGYWWYVLKDYKYPSNTIYTIDGADYAFDRKGWLITNDRINQQGVVAPV